MDLRAICLASPEFVDVNYVPGPPFFLLLRRTTLFQDYICLVSSAVDAQPLFFDVQLFCCKILVGMLIVE